VFGRRLRSAEALFGTGRACVGDRLGSVWSVTNRRESLKGGGALDVALLLARLGLATVFAAAALGKLADRDGSRLALRRFGVPAGLVAAIGVGLPVFELLVTGGLVLVASAAWAAGGAVALLLVFCVAIVRLLARGETPDCHCFGMVGSAPVGRGTLARNVVLIAVAGFVAVAGWNYAGMSVFRLAADLGALAIVLGLAMVIHGAFSWQLFKQNSRLLERVSDLEAALGRGPSEQPAEQLAIGDPAPSFALPDLDGQTVSLETLLGPGRGVVLVFTDPACGHCNALLPALGRARGKQEPALAVISRGSYDENRAKATEHGIARVLLQQDFEVAEAYGNYGMPGAFLIDAAGRIASPRTVGTEAVSELLRAAQMPPLLQVATARAANTTTRRVERESSL
jgi:peroxiredoxin